MSHSPRPHVRVAYEPQVGVAYVYLVDPARGGGSKRCETALDGNVVFDLDARGRILGIEILDTSALLREETLAEAERPKREPNPSPNQSTVTKEELS
jgi:uncharacterized protein YuzE